jgi:nucleoside-diphosphate-sugar epimerase
MNGAVLITGANGFLGRRCVERFARSGHDIVAVWHTNDSHLRAPVLPNVRYERCDLTDARAVRSLITRFPVESVLHAAAILPDGRPGYLSRAALSNVFATACLAEAAAEAGCKWFAYCSSISVYDGLAPGDDGWTEDVSITPASAYAWSKYAGEECVRLCCDAASLRAVALRLAGVHGPGRNGGCIFHMMRAAVRGEPLIVNNADQRFQFLFVDDAAAMIETALRLPQPANFECVNVASHEVPTLRHIAEAIVGVANSRSEIRFGNTTPFGAQIMNLDRMIRRFGREVSTLEARLEQMYRYFETTGA